MLVGPYNSNGEPLSYPFGLPRNAVSRPMIRDLQLATAAANVTLRMLVLHRDPMACTYSRIRQMKVTLEKHELLQARLVLDNLQALSWDVRSLPCGSVSTVPYEELLARPEDFAEPLADFTGIAHEDMSRALGEVIRASSAHSYESGLGVKQVQGLDDFFGYENGSLIESTVRRQGWWPLISPELDVRNIGRDMSMGTDRKGKGGGRRWRR